MHNINFIRENPIEFDNYMKQRGEHPISNKILELDKVKRETQTVLQNLLAERNSISCLLYTSPSPRDGLLSRMPSSA